MSRTKYNVDRHKEKRTFHDIVFDSEMEMKYYRDVLCPMVESGKIIKCELQKKYELQPSFIHFSKKVQPILYIADFYILTCDHKEIVIDIKGCPDKTAILKRKLFWYVYPDLDYRWITYVKKYGGWRDYDEVKQLRKMKK